MHTTLSTGKTGEKQGKLWSARSDDWAAGLEAQMRPVFEHGLEVLGVSERDRLLDVGCGAGLALRLAADRGADVSGLDAAEGMLAHARRRVPGAPIVQGEIEELPFSDSSFDVVTGFNSFQYAASPTAAVAEAVRVTRPGGRLLALVWGPAELCEATPYLAAVGALMPPPPPGAPGPVALSTEEALTGLFTDAGLESISVGDIRAVLQYDDETTAVRALISAGPAVAAIEHSGEPAVRSAIATSIEPLRRPDGSYAIANVFRYAVGTSS